MRVYIAAAVLLSFMTLTAAQPQVSSSMPPGRPGTTLTRDTDARTAAALSAVTQCVSLVEALRSGAELPADVLHADGCYVWQQPGVALVPTALWITGQSAPEMWLDSARWSGLLLDLSHFSWDDPASFPTEEQELSGQPRQAQVYLLDAERATSRLADYYADYQSWVDLNDAGEGQSAGQPPDPGAPAFDPFMEVQAAALRADFAVVYLAADGPLEFYLQRAPSGRIGVRHIIYWSYFSA